MNVSQKQLRLLYELHTDALMTPGDCKSFDDELVAAYIESELSGGDPATAFPQLRAHLESCATCQAEYTELKALLQFEEIDTLQALPFVPIFDFSFLARLHKAQPPTDQPERPWQVDVMGRLMIRFSQALLQTLQPKPQMEYGLKRAEGAEILYSFPLQPTVDDLNVGITVRTAPHPAGQCTIAVEVEIPSRGGWPNLAATTVVLRHGDTLLQRQQTDAFGKTLFRSIPIEQLPHLVFEITPTQNQSELR